MDTVFWFTLSLVFVIMALFPQLVSWISGLMGFVASVNFVFLVTIFLLLIRCFLLSIRVSQLDDKIKNLVEEIAIKENLKNESEKDKT
jgi:hypothetical protein